MERLLLSHVMGVDCTQVLRVYAGNCMNETIARQADQYRQKAEEVRAVAEATRDLVCRDALRRLADGYERLAGNLDRVASRQESSEPQHATGS